MSLKVPVKGRCVHAKAQSNDVQSSTPAANMFAALKSPWQRLSTAHCFAPCLVSFFKDLKTLYMKILDILLGKPDEQFSAIRSRNKTIVFKIKVV